MSPFKQFSLWDTEKEKNVVTDELSPCPGVESDVKVCPLTNYSLTLARWRNVHFELPLNLTNHGEFLRRSFPNTDFD